MAMHKLSQLEAVNQMLSAVGQLPVNTIVGDVNVDVTRALATLNTVSMQVQGQGWKFNTETGYVATPDSSKRLVFPDNVLSFVPEGRTGTVMRGNTLFDTQNATYEFTGTIKGTAILALEWDLMPNHARQYIAIKAARLFQDETTGSETGHSFKVKDEAAAWSDFRRAEVNFGQYNFLGRNG